MEKLLDTGKVKTVGVPTSPPILSPNYGLTAPSYRRQTKCNCIRAFLKLKAFCEEKGILLTAHTPLGRAESKVFVELETIVDISKSPSVLLS
ncbi:hypothetical protein BDN71DRAFT_485600 [Pleurotus eryngii]|uniref:Uncharacterized protein n=1 Tax=Pleurotus eryngii TaxID=5323 RepID=A0A9P6A9J8_PLEER|nr:hypothetical protein BDN71DRAFT_485600 [Pleurotus eryngii]